MSKWSQEDVDALKRILLRVQANALSERNKAQRYLGPYGDKRDVFLAQYSEMAEIHNEATYFLKKIEELKK
jgi:hypothetical protein